MKEGVKEGDGATYIRIRIILKLFFLGHSEARPDGFKLTHGIRVCMVCRFWQIVGFQETPISHPFLQARGERDFLLFVGC